MASPRGTIHTRCIRGARAGDADSRVLRPVPAVRSDDSVRHHLAHVGALGADWHPVGVVGAYLPPAVREGHVSISSEVAGPKDLGTGSYHHEEPPLAVLEVDADVLSTTEGADGKSDPLAHVMRLRVGTLQPGRELLG